METLLMKIRTTKNPGLADDEVVRECMRQLMEKWPQVTGYQFERAGDDYINILMWGDLDS